LIPIEVKKSIMHNDCKEVLNVILRNLSCATKLKAAKSNPPKTAGGILSRSKMLIFLWSIIPVKKTMPAIASV
jgi:hypothetical protein